MLKQNFIRKVTSVALSASVFAGSLLSFGVPAANAVLVTAPSLAITNQVDKNQADRGEFLNYTITVTNNGGVGLTKIVSWINPLNLATWVNGSGTWTRNGVVNPLPDTFPTTGAQNATTTPLNSGESIVFKFRTQVAQNANMDDIIWLVFNANSDQTPNVVTSASWTRTILANPALCAELTADKSTVVANDVVTFTAKICNKGNVILHNVMIGHVIQSPFRYVNGSAQLKMDNQVTNVEDHWIQDGFRINDLNPGQEAFLTFRMTISNEVKDGQMLQHVIQVKSDETPNWVQCPVYLNGKVLGITTPPTELPNTGPGEVMLLIAGLVPAGFLLKKFKSRI